MASVYKFFFLFLAAFLLLSCGDENVVKLSSNVKQSFEGFVRDTSAYVMIVDSSVQSKPFKEKLVPVEKGGFAEHFSKNKHEIQGRKIFYAYSDSISPFVRGMSDKSSFFDVVALAFANHYSLEINPDDIWLMILDGFRYHVKSNRDALKDKFVAPGTDTVVAFEDNSLTTESTHREWFWTLANLFEILQSKLPEETGLPLKIKFSTTSPVDYNISSAMVMAVASEYYVYLVSTFCGIPKIKINGKKEDWILLKDSFNRLASRLDMDWWAVGLNPVLDEFINVFDGKINMDHWRGIYKQYVPEGCGNVTFNGWISRFFPYTGLDLNESNYSDESIDVYRRHSPDWNEQLDAKNVPRGVTSVRIEWNYLGERIPLKLYTGFIGVQVDTTTNMLKAARGYALFESFRF